MSQTELQVTFAGVALSEFASRGPRKNNGTHLYDLAERAAVAQRIGEIRDFSKAPEQPLEG